MMHIMRFVLRHALPMPWVNMFWHIDLANVMPNGNNIHVSVRHRTEPVIIHRGA